MNNRYVPLTYKSTSEFYNGLNNVQLFTHAEFFGRNYIDESMCYILFDKLVEIDNILENVYEISSLEYFNGAYSCKFTYNLIGHIIVQIHSMFVPFA